jgi:hypothetical protein
MSVLSSIPNGASNKDIRDTINALIRRIAALEAEGTPTPATSPVFTSQPSITPSSGTAGVTVYTATSGIVDGGVITSRVWLLNGTSISTGLTAAPAAGLQGTLTYQEFASGAGGTAGSAVQAAAVVAASTSTPTPTPTPANTRANSTLVRANNSNFSAQLSSVEQQISAKGG